MNYFPFKNKTNHFVLIVKGIQIRPDPIPYRNDKRREFCSRHEGYGDFCNGRNSSKRKLFEILL